MYKKSVTMQKGHSNTTFCENIRCFILNDIFFSKVFFYCYFKFFFKVTERRCASLYELTVHFFIWTKALILAKKAKNKNQACYPAEYKNKRVYATHSWNNKYKTSEQSCHLYFTVCRLFLLAHFNIAKLFNDYILFQEYTPFKFVCLLYIRESSFTFLQKKVWKK